ncbi:MAG: 3-isopropylmalate dehydratase small subunit [Candidatus Parvarchaeota archaeon]
MKGRVHLLGDNIDTDMLAPGPYIHMNIDVLKRHCLEALQKDWSSNVSKGDIIIAGANFGCGSSREQAVIVLKELGINLVVAKTFSRLFFRNAVNFGLNVGFGDFRDIFLDGEEVNYSVEKRVIKGKREVKFTGVSGPPLEILEKGGLINYFLSRSE